MKHLPPLLLLLALLGIHAAPAAALEVSIVSPPPGQPLFGEAEIVAVVRGGRAQRVEIYFDRVRVGVIEKPPYRTVVDAGQDNAEHHIEVVAYDASGGSVTASLTTPRLQVDEEIDVQLQQLFVSVDSGGRPVPLTRESFTILDDGVEQEMITFERGDIPFSAVLLLDASLSMRGGRLDRALDGARSFVRAMSRLDEAKLVLFSDRILQETPFTNVASLLTLGLTDLEARGGTALNDALYLGVKRLDGRLARKVVVLLSDGVDVESVLAMERVRAVVRQSQAVVYWLRLRRDEEGEDAPLQLLYSAWRDAEGHRKEMDELRSAVLESGGRIEPIGRIEDVPGALSRILQELRDQYVLGYSPSVHKGPGTWHRIELRVRGAEGAKVRVQEGYVER